MIATWRFYPAMWRCRYDFLVLADDRRPGEMLAGRLETLDKPNIILYQAVVTDGDIQDRGRLMDQSRRKPMLPNRGVPLSPASCIPARQLSFTGPGACSISRSAPSAAGRLIALSAHLPQLLHPRLSWSMCTFAVRLRPWLFGRTASISRSGATSRDAVLLGLMLVSVFIWLSEKGGTFTKIWLYPSQRHGWSMVSIEKLGSWFRAADISYTLVSLINAPRAVRATRSNAVSSWCGATQATPPRHV